MLSVEKKFYNYHGSNSQLYLQDTDLLEVPYVQAVIPEQKHLQISLPRSKSNLLDTRPPCWVISEKKNALKWLSTKHFMVSTQKLLKYWIGAAWGHKKKMRGSEPVRVQGTQHKDMGKGVSISIITYDLLWRCRWELSGQMSARDSVWGHGQRRWYQCDFMGHSVRKWTTLKMRTSTRDSVWVHGQESQYQCDYMWHNVRMWTRLKMRMSTRDSVWGHGDGIQFQDYMGYGVRIWARDSQFEGEQGTTCENMDQEVSITIIINYGNPCEDRWNWLSL